MQLHCIYDIILFRIKKAHLSAVEKAYLFGVMVEKRLKLKDYSLGVSITQISMQVVSGLWLA